jgi:DNA-binding transcriptional LysR family regulator
MGLIEKLSLDQLRVLVTIADSGSFSAAGRRLNRAQSAISQSVATLEAMQGITLFDRSGHRPSLTDAGRVLVSQARLVLSSAARFEAVAAGARAGIEPELSLAIDPLVPTAPLIASLRALHQTYPHLPVNFSTEGLGGALRRLRSGDVALAVCLLLPSIPQDVVASTLFQVKLVPVVSTEHPLASLGRPATRGDLAGHIQLVLSDPVDREANNYGLISAAPWRFVDLGRRLDFLLSGFGWCWMPEHLVEHHVATGALVEIDLAEDARVSGESLSIYAARMARNVPGPAGQWLLNDLQSRLSRLRG